MVTDERKRNGGKARHLIHNAAKTKGNNRVIILCGFCRVLLIISPELIGVAFKPIN